MATQKGIIFLSYSAPKITKNTVLQIAQLAKRQTGLTFNQVVGVPAFDKGITLPAQWQLDIKKINVMATKAKASKAKGEDSEVLEIKPIDKPVEPTIEPESEATVEDTPKEEEKEEEDKKEEKPVEEPETSESQPKVKKPSKGLVLSLLATLVVGGALTGGILYSRTSLDTRSKAAAPEVTPTPTPEATSTPEATPTVEALDLTEYSINILNGSGIAGQAGVVNDLLEEAGFDSLDTGNADSYDYEETEISLAESTPKAVFDAIKKALEDDYEVTKSDAIEEDSDYDILIIVGQ